MRRSPHQSPKAVLGLESLEHRDVPATVSVIREATGANAAAMPDGSWGDASRDAIGSPPWHWRQVRLARTVWMSLACSGWQLWQVFSL